MHRLVGLLVLTILALTLPDVVRQTARPAVAQTPLNVVLVLTDDQPYGTLQKMPHVLALADRGMTFTKAFVSNALCCPSRATLLTGLLAGHTGVWTNGDGSLRWGGWPAFRRNGINDDGSLFKGTGNNESRTLALYLQQAGYRTGLFGKYLNHYDKHGVAPPTPRGWSTWHSFVGDNAKYYQYTSDDNGALHVHGKDASDYSTDVFGADALAFLRSPSIQDGTKPFFLYFAPYAPHGAIVPSDRDMDVTAPVRFETAAFNERDVSDKPPFVRATDLLTPREHTRMATSWDHQYGALVSVDRWLGRFEASLPTDVLHRTVFVFMSDNGLEWGDHRLQAKGDPYERSVHVPLIIAGPGIQHVSVGPFVMNADITPTILDLAGLAGVGGPYDGVSLVPVLRGVGTLSRKSIPLEHLSAYGVPSFCGVRTRGWAYILYLDGFQELYNLANDPHELRNVAKARPHVRDRLRARALHLCKPRPPNW